MRPSSLFLASPATALALALLRVAGAHPFERIGESGCSMDSLKLSMDIVCGETNAVLNCIQSFASESESIEQCLEEAGCTSDEAHSETTWIVEQCARLPTDAREGALELRHMIAARETTTASTSTETSTSSTTSTASSTSTSSSNSSSSGFTPVSYLVAVLMALFAAGCIGGICFSCCSERSARKKAAHAAEAKEALMGSQ